jgi:hypothetical protein
MTEAPPSAGPEQATRDLVVVWTVGLVVAAGLGFAATLIRPEQFWLVFGVFTACSLAPCLGLAWLVLGAGRRVRPDPHAEENVESRWVEKAASGALFDTLPAAGLTAGAVSLFGLDLAADTALVGVVAFAVVDGVLRFALLRRREA